MKVIIDRIDRIDRRKYVAANQLTRALVRAPRRILAVCLALAFLILTLGVAAGLRLTLERYVTQKTAAFTQVYDSIATITNTSQDSLLRARLAIEAVINIPSPPLVTSNVKPVQLGHGAYFVANDNLVQSPTVYLLSDIKDIDDRNTDTMLSASSYISLLRYNNRIFAKYIEHSYVLTPDGRFLSVQPAFPVLNAARNGSITDMSQFIQPISNEISVNLKKLPITTLRNDTFWSAPYLDPIIGQEVVLNAVAVFRGGDIRLINAHAIPLSQFHLPPDRSGRFGVFMRDGASVISNNPLDNEENLRNRKTLQQAMPNWIESLHPAIHRVGNLVTISQTIGNTHWTLVSLISIRELLSDLSATLLIYGLLWLACGAGLVYVYFLINQQLFLPAERQSSELVEARRFAEALINAAPIGLCVFARNGARIMIQNHAAADILGRADSEKLEPLQQALFSAHTSAHAIQVSGGTLLCAELSLQTTAGAKFLSAYYSPSKLRNQDVLICVFVDISERKENELIWERAREVTESANQAKSAFLASVSHELRTPLHGMLGGIELLSRMELPPVSREYVNSVWDSAQNLLLIINSVLDFSKIEANKIEILKRPGSIREVAQRVAKLHAIIAEKKALRLFLYVDPAIPEYLIFDAVRVEQILTNLCNNAIKFTDQGRIQIRLELVSRDGEQLLLRGQVIDSGVGMSQQDQAALFQPFFQGDDTQLRNSGGTGLGLAICKRLLGLMGGDIKVLSDRGLGSCFTFTLPVQHDQGRIDFLDLLNAPLSDKPLYGMFEQREIQMLITEICHHFGGVITAVSVETLRGYDFPPGALLLTDAADDKLSVLTGNPRIVSITQHISGLAAPVSSLQQRVPSLSLREITLTILESCGAIKSGHVAYEPGQAADGVRPHRGLRVLLVEDHPVNLYILAEQLRMLGCKVLTAQNGREALMRLKDQIIDVVVTDINMPVMDGIEFARNLRLESTDLPIVGMTSSVDRELMRGAMEAGMDMCLTKPLTLQHLDDALTAMREKHHRYGGVSAISQQYQAEASPGAVSLKNSDKTAHQIYLSSYRHDIELLTQALQEGSLTNVGDRLHRIEGVLGFLGADASYALSRRVHTELKSTASVSQAIRDDCHILIAEMEALARLYQQENSVGAA